MRLWPYDNSAAWRSGFAIPTPIPVVELYHVNSHMPPDSHGKSEKPKFLLLRAGLICSEVCSKEMRVIQVAGGFASNRRTLNVSFLSSTGENAVFFLFAHTYNQQSNDQTS